MNQRVRITFEVDAPTLEEVREVYTSVEEAIRDINPGGAQHGDLVEALSEAMGVDELHNVSATLLPPTEQTS